MSDEPEIPAVPVPDEATPTPPLGHCGLVAVVGAANAGKSSLINKILGEKVSIVSPIAQTTRNVVRGIHSEPRGQIVFLDTPGVHKAQGELGRRMNQVARESVSGVDMILLLMDASHHPYAEDEGWMRRIATHEGAQPVFVLTKSDLPCQPDSFHRLWETLKEEKASKVEPAWFAVSAKTGDGVDALVQALFDCLPPSPPLFPEDLISDFPKRWLISDLMREKLIRDLTGEVPHQLCILVDDLVETDDTMHVTGRILVERNSQIGILLGHKGHRLTKVRKLTEEEVGAIYEKKVKLDFRVKAERKWDQNFWIMRQLGYT